MRQSFVFLAVIFSTSAWACEFQTAQFIARVDTVEETRTGCRVQLKLDGIIQFNPAYKCPLSYGEVSAAGIEVALEKGGKCPFEPGDQISGILYRERGGDIHLEN